MGSRRGRHAALVAAALLGGCTVGAPPGFSSGDTWTVPLVGPLEDGLLLVPADVNGKGPFLFAIDSDAQNSIVDKDVVQLSGARTGEGPHLLDETDTQQPRFFAEILSWEIGTLEVQGPRPAEIVPAGTFDADGRRIYGVIGRDIIADSLTFTFDRDQGVVILQTIKATKTPPNATAVGYTLLKSRIDNAEVQPLSRRLVSAKVDGQNYALHVDFGATPSQLRMRSWDKAKLTPSDLQIALVDEVGMPREVKKQGLAATVELAGLTATDVSFVPFVDRRWLEQDIEGTLGLSFFKRFSVMVNWDSKKIFMWPRKDPTTNTVARLGRWHSKRLEGCEHLGCVTVKLIDPLANKPADAPPPADPAAPPTTAPTPAAAPAPVPTQHPGLVASITRDASSITMPLEVLVAVTPAGGKPPLKWMVVNLPAGIDRALAHLSADYIGATLTVLDASPFPRECPANGGCVDLVAPPQTITPPAGSPEPQAVAPEQVKRIAGDAEIVPDDVEKLGLDGKTLRATMKICVAPTGAIRTMQMVEVSSNPDYNTKLLLEVRTHWRYEPFVVNGQPVAFCTLQPFSYHGPLQ